MTEQTTQETVNDAGSKVDPVQQGKVGVGDVEVKEEPKKEEPAYDPKAEIERMRAENEELRTLTRNTLKRATDAEGFVQNLTGKLEEIAARRGDGPTSHVDPNEIRDRVRERINEDPMSVLDEHYRSRTAPLVERFQEQQGQTNRQLFMARMSNSEEGREVLKDYMEEVDGFLKDFGPEHRAAPDAYDAALRWVLSKPDNFQKEVERRVRKEREKEKTHFTEAGTSGERAPRETKRELTALEKEVATGLGLSEEEYIKYKEG